MRASAEGRAVRARRARGKAVSRVRLEREREMWVAVRSREARREVGWSLAWREGRVRRRRVEREGRRCGIVDAAADAAGEDIV